MSQNELRAAAIAASGRVVGPATEDASRNVDAMTVKKCRPAFLNSTLPFCLVAASASGRMADEKSQDQP